MNNKSHIRNKKQLRPCRFTLMMMTLLSCSILYAQDGTLDLSFEPAGGADASIHKMALQDDGKVVIAGSFTLYDGVSRKGIARVNTDGTLDSTFDPGGAIIIEWGQYARALAIQADGKIMMGGTFTNYDNNFTNRIVRINQDGSYDPTFNATNVPGYGGINGEVDVIRIQPDGKILVGGTFVGSGSYASKNVIRFMPDGSVDSTFVGNANSGTGASSVSDIAIQADGKIIVVGNFTSYGTTIVNNIARLNPDGTLDNTFNTGTGCDNAISAITLQPDGKIIISGWFHYFNSVIKWNVARLNSDGSLDSTFASNLPLIPASYINCHAIQPDSKVIVNAEWTRLYDNGLKDTTEWYNGSFAGGGITSLVIQPDGKILASGFFTSFDGIARNRILRLNGASTNGLSERTETATVTIYPNPGNGMVRFTSSEILSGIRIYNLLGEIVYSNSVNALQSDVDLSHQPGGVYVYKVVSRDQTVHSGRIIVN